MGEASAATRRGKAAVGVVIAAASLGGCGTYEWPDRPMTVTPGSFVVHEDALMSTTPRKSSEGTGLPQACSAPMMKLTIDASCDDRCGPIRVTREGKPIASLLAPEVKRPSTVDPDRVDRPYATPPVDASRVSLALAAPSDPLIQYSIEGRCALTAKSGGGPPPSKESDKKLSFRVPPSCGYLVEVSCR